MVALRFLAMLATADALDSSESNALLQRNTRQRLGIGAMGLTDDTIVGTTSSKDAPDTLAEIPYSQMKVRQSSTGWGGSASRPLTHDASSSYGGRTCTHTHRDSPSFWRASLDRVWRVKEVELMTRGDCCWNRLDGAQIWVGNTKCADNLKFGRGEKKRIPCVAEGADITVRLGRRDYLTICSFRAFGVEGGEAGTRTLIPYSDMVATEISSSYGSRPERSLTLTPNTRWPGTCTYAKAKSKAWWKVTLKKHWNIQAIVLTNRVGYRPQRLQGIDVYVDETLCASGVNVDEKLPTTIACEAAGTEIKLQQRGNEILTLCGFAAYGFNGCGGYACKTPGWILKPNATLITDISETSCCEQATCGHFTCPALHTKKSGVEHVIGASAKLCCDAATLSVKSPGDVTCGANELPIEDEASCQAAAMMAANASFVDSFFWRGMGKGCFHYRGKGVYFNERAGQANKMAKPICIVSASA